jgi:hypothetical protein
MINGRRLRDITTALRLSAQSKKALAKHPQG